MHHVKKAVIPAAGMGTRFLPATKVLPKEMLPIIDAPVIQYTVEEAAAAGIEDIIIVNGRGKRGIEDHFDQSFELEHFLEQKCQFESLKEIRRISEIANIHYIRQKEPLGLGHAILQASRHIGKEPFAVLLPDEIFQCKVPVIKQLVEFYEKTGANVLAVQSVNQQEVSGYGMIKHQPEVNGLMKIEDFVEKPKPEEAPSNLAIVGRYVVEPRLFKVLKKTAPGLKGEIQLTDALKELGKNRDIYAMQIKGKRYDVGNKLGYLKALVEFALARKDIGPEFREFIKGLK